MNRNAWFVLGVLGVLAGFAPGHAAELQTRNLFLIVSDGLRWQEVFRGAEEALLTAGPGGVKNTNALRLAFWRETPSARREALLPFLWSGGVRQGQILGNPELGSTVVVSNGLNFSYPGYSEMLTGVVDPGINSNDKRPNPNRTVFEWLNGRGATRGRVAIFATWDVFPYIFNVGRSRLPIWPADEPEFDACRIQPPDWIEAVRRDTTPMFEGVTYDSFLIHAAIDQVRRKRPRLVFVGFGETDEWAHAGRYDQYLTAAHHVDAFVHRLWDTVQSMSEYRGRTTFIVTADHGRGSGLSDWKDHGRTTVGSEGMWVAVMGPDTPPVGEQVVPGRHTLGQVASTVTALLGQDWRAENPAAVPPLSGVLRGR